jgi:hypothetical protein
MKNKVITKKEMKDLFKKHNLHLSFPVLAISGNYITDWTYWYHYKTYQESDLKKFKELIEKEYNHLYKIIPCGVGASIKIEKI